MNTILLEALFIKWFTVPLVKKRFHTSVYNAETIFFLLVAGSKRIASNNKNFNIRMYTYLYVHLHEKLGNRMCLICLELSGPLGFFIEIL